MSACDGSDFPAKNPDNLPLYVYDLGFEAEQLRYLARMFPWARLEAFDYSKYPFWFDIDIVRGEYAWKAPIIKSLIDEVAPPVCLDESLNFCRAYGLQTSRQRVNTGGYVRAVARLGRPDA